MSKAATPWVGVGKNPTQFTQVPKNTGVWETADITLESFLYNDPTVLYGSADHGYDYLKPLPPNQLNRLNPTPWSTQ